MRTSCFCVCCCRAQYVHATHDNGETAAAEANEGLRRCDELDRAKRAAAAYGTRKPSAQWCARAALDVHAAVHAIAPALANNPGSGEDGVYAVLSLAAAAEAAGRHEDAAVQISDALTRAAACGGRRAAATRNGGQDAEPPPRALLLLLRGHCRWRAACKERNAPDGGTNAKGLRVEVALSERFAVCLAAAADDANESVKLEPSPAARSLAALCALRANVHGVARAGAATGARGGGSVAAERLVAIKAAVQSLRALLASDDGNGGLFGVRARGEVSSGNFTLPMRGAMACPSIHAASESCAA